MFDSLSWLSHLLGKEYFRIAFISVLHSFMNVITIIYAILFRDLLDSVISGDAGELKKYLYVFVLVLFFQCIASALQKLFKERCLINIENKIKKKVVSDIVHGDFSSVTEIHSGEWMNRLSNDINIVVGNCLNLVSDYVGIVIHLFVAALVLSRLLPGFITTILIVMLLALAVEFFFYRQYKNMHKEVQEKEGNWRVFVQECLNSLMVIKSYAKEDMILAEQEMYLNKCRNVRIRKNNFYVLINFFFSMGVNGLVLLSALYCAYEIIRGKITYGTFVAVIQIVSQMRSPVANAYSGIPSFYSMLGSIERLRRIEDQSLDIAEELFPGKMDSFQEIKFDKVSFSYKDRNKNEKVITDLSLSFKKGEFVGICGPSGCGKSTLFKLLLALHKPLNGEIRVCVDNAEFALDSSFRKLFAYVPQDKQLMKGSIRQIVCFGEDFDQDKMNNVLRLSCCDKFIEGLEQGIETELKENGSGLSDGQIQRIAIARALYSDRPILLLDEATSSLDEELEIDILENIRNMTEKTVLFITHHKKALQYTNKLVECREKGGNYRWYVS